MTKRSTSLPQATIQPSRWSRLHAAIKRRGWMMLLAATTGLGSVIPSEADAADGCLVLLCLAAPSWQNVSQCVDPVRQVLHDLSRGHPFPSCSMSGAGNSGANRWADPPSFCPPQYTRSYELSGSLVYACDYAGAVVVTINGTVWTRTWWSLSGDDAVTEFTPTARAQLTSWDSRFDDDYAAWLASPPPVVGCTTC